LYSFSLLLAAEAQVSQAEQPTAPPDRRPRLIILADSGNEPDEKQRMVPMPVNSNEFKLRIGRMALDVDGE
jgi:hypothetical protein